MSCHGSQREPCVYCWSGESDGIIQDHCRAQLRGFDAASQVTQSSMAVGRASPGPPPTQKQDPRLKILPSKPQFPHLLKESKSSLHWAQVKWKSTKHEESPHGWAHACGHTATVVVWTDSVIRGSTCFYSFLETPTCST